MTQIDPLEPIQAVEIYEPDLEDVLTTLNTVYHYCISYDLFNQYKNLSNTVQASPLTKQVDRTRRRIQGILDDYREQMEPTDGEEEAAE
jgi:hypothetical protein